MSAHDRAAANHARQRFTLTVMKSSDGCMSTREFPGLTQAEVEEEQAYQRLTVSGSQAIDFDVERE